MSGKAMRIWLRVWKVIAVVRSVFVFFLKHDTGFPCLLGSPGFFKLKIPGPGKSWKITLVLESPGKMSLKVMHFSSGSNGRQAAIV